MFERFIKRIIDKLKETESLLLEVYNETYGGIELTREFNKKADEIKKKNKDKFISEMKKYAEKDCYEQTGIKLPSCISNDIAFELYAKAKKMGVLDIINNFKEEEE